MVDILTSSGILLDISPDAEFDLTIENPIFSDERISAPWSTDIAFLPTLRNKRAFGYMGALMSAPSVTELAATIIVQGIHLISGTLIYDGLSDGCLNYTFTSRDLSVDWAKKLYELPFLGDAENGIDYMREVLAGDIDGISAPVIVNAALESDADWNLDEANIGRKYRNAADMDEPAKGFIPAITAAKLMSHAGLSAEVSGDLRELFRTLSILGTMWTNWLPWTKSGSYSLNLTESLPDISLKDFISELCKMCCSAVFLHRGKIHIISYNTIASADPVVWDDRVSDSFEVENSEGTGYSLSYRNSPENTGAEAVPEIEVSALPEVFDHFDKTGAVPQYLSIIHKPSGDIYSIGFDRVAKPSDSKWQAGNYLSSKLTGFGKYETGEASESEDVSIGLTPAPCVPVKYSLSESENDRYMKMAPLVSIPGVGAARPSEAVVVLAASGQATDNGYIVGSTAADVSIGLRLDPAFLFDRYHKSFAAMKNKDMSTITVDVSLSVYELAALKIWSKVSIYGRNYLLSKISVRMTATSSGRLTASCELLSL